MTDGNDPRVRKPGKRTVGSIPVPCVPWQEPKAPENVDTTKVASEENSP